MKSQFISDLRSGSAVDSIFLVLEKEQRTSMKDQTRQFLQVKVGDRTGSMRVKVFEDYEELGKLFEVGDHVRIRGIVQQYAGNLEMILRLGDLEKVPPKGLDSKDFIRTTQKDVEKMIGEMEQEAAGFKNPHLRALLNSFFSDSSLMQDFKTAPAAKIHHHTYIGGLVEHTHGVFTICKCISGVFPDLDRELLLAGAILHDIGKIRDYQFELSSNIEITDSGGLVGHIFAGDEILRAKISSIPNFQEELALRLRHMLIAHHNKGEWGSPVEPRFKEAIALHYADLADSHIAQAVSVEEEEQRKERSGAWSSFVRGLDRMLYLGKKK